MSTEPALGALVMAWVQAELSPVTSRGTVEAQRAGSQLTAP